MVSVFLLYFLEKKLSKIFLWMFLLGGCIDADYEGTIGVLLFNHSTRTVYIKQYNMIAQIIFVKRFGGPVEYSSTDSDDVAQIMTAQPRKRGAGGFGSTGNF